MVASPIASAHVGPSEFGGGAGISICSIAGARGELVTTTLPPGPVGGGDANGFAVREESAATGNDDAEGGVRGGSLGAGGEGYTW